MSCSILNSNVSKVSKWVSNRRLRKIFISRFLNTIFSVFLRNHERNAELSATFRVFSGTFVAFVAEIICRRNHLQHRKYAFYKYSNNATSLFLPLIFAKVYKVAVTVCTFPFCDLCIIFERPLIILR